MSFSLLKSAAGNRFLTAALCLTVLASEAQTPGADLTVPAELQSILAAHAPTGMPTRLLAGYTSVEELDHKTNLSKIYVDSTAEFLRLESGLTGALGTTVYRNGAAKGAGRGANLCGLMTVLSESQSTTDTSSAAVIPMGKLFVPFGVKSSVDFSNRYRLMKLDASIPSVCKPAEGEAFSFQFEAEHTMKTSGLFGGTKVIRRASKSKCKVAGEAIPASKINSSLQGDALLVSCESEDQNEKKSTEEYVYLKDSAFYLMTSRVDEWQRSKIQYTAAPYAAP